MSSRVVSEQKILEEALPAQLVSALQNPSPSSDVLSESCRQLAQLLERLRPFVPPSVYDRVRLQSEDVHERMVPLQGTLLLARIAGLHTLSTRTGASARERSERRGVIASQLFSALFDEILVHGGGILRFGVDTIVAFFDAVRLPITHAADAGVAALAMQAHVGSLQEGLASEAEHIHLRIALQSGQLSTVLVGDEGHVDLLVRGHAVNRAERLLNSSAPGEIIIADTMLTGAHRFIAEQKYAGVFMLQGVQADQAALQQIVPPADDRPADAELLQLLVRQIEQLLPFLPPGFQLRQLGVEGGLGDFRPVTAVSVDCVALGKLLNLLEIAALEQPTIVGQVLNTYVVGLQRVIQGYGGVIADIEMTASASRVLAIFGAPVLHEDDPIRALRAAQELPIALEQISAEIAAMLLSWVSQNPRQQWLLKTAQLALTQRIGIARGNVFVGVIGSNERKQYTVIGETIDLAPRLLSGSATGILMSSSTYRAVQHMVQALPVTPLTIRDLARSIPLYQIVSGATADNRATRVVRYDATLIGRENELNTLLSFARAALQNVPGAPRVIAIAGEPGAGKSRLAEELLYPLYLDVPTVLVCHEYCHSYEQTTPYTIAARLLPQVLQLDPLPDRAAQANMMAQQVAQLVPEWSRFTPLLGAFLGLPIEETELTGGLTPQDRHDRLYDLVVVICQAVARQRPLLLVIDDFHWIDASSQAMFAHLGRELSGYSCVLLPIARPSSLLDEPWRTWAEVASIPLGDLDRGTSAALLAALLNDDPPTELRSLIERTQGTPLFLEEMVRYLQDLEVLQRNGEGRWICTRPVDDVAVPSQIEQLIIARLDRLHGAARHTLELAAVIGQQMSLALLRDASGDAEIPEVALASLEQESILVPVTSPDGPTLQFTHVLTREVAYDSISFARRRMLHAQVAAALERADGDTPSEERIILAEHYIRAGQPAQAYPHLVRAAERAQKRYANSEALALYRRAIEMTAGAADELIPLASVADVYERIGDILALTGDFDRARQSYEWFLDGSVAETTPDVALRRAALWRKIGGTYENQGDLDQAMRCLTQSTQFVALADQEANSNLAFARVLSDMGWIAFRRNELDEAQRYLENALLLIEGRAAHAEEAQILNRLGGLAWRRGNLQLAQHYVRRSLTSHQESGSLVGQAHALNNLGNLSGSQGTLSASLDYGLQAMAINERIGNRRELAVSANNVGWAYFDQEKYVLAARYFQQALDLAIELNDSYVQMQVLLNLGRVVTHLERWDEAGELLHRSLALAEQLQLIPEQLECHVALAELWLQHDDPARAREAYEHAGLFVGERDTEEYARFQRLEGRLELVSGRREQGLALLSEAEKRFRAMLNTPEADRTRALLQRARGVVR